MFHDKLIPQRNESCLPHFKIGEGLQKTENPASHKRRLKNTVSNVQRAYIYFADLLSSTRLSTVPSFINSVRLKRQQKRRYWAVTASPSRCSDSIRVLLVLDRRCTAPAQHLAWLMLYGIIHRTKTSNQRGYDLSPWYREQEQLGVIGSLAGDRIWKRGMLWVSESEVEVYPGIQ